MTNGCACFFMRASLSLEGMGCELPPGAAAYTQPGDPPPFNIVIRYVPLPKRSAPRAKPGGVNFRPSNRVLRIVLPKDRVVRATLAVSEVKWLSERCSCSLPWASAPVC